MNSVDSPAPPASAQAQPHTPGDATAYAVASPGVSNASTAVPADVAKLFASPFRYNLFQAISLLERSASRADRRTVALGVSDGRSEGIRFKAHIALQFPSADIREVRMMPYAQRRAPADATAYVLSTAVMSLAGSQGPLPLPFTELILQRNAARDYATAEFLDIFHHRFLSFLYRSRKKHTASLHTTPLQDAPILRSIAALANLGELAVPQAAAREEIGVSDANVVDTAPAISDTQNGLSTTVAAPLRPWLQHAGLLGPAPRSMTGLLTLLGDRLKERFTGRQFIGAWQDLDQSMPWTLGSTVQGNGGRANHGAAPAGLAGLSLQRRMSETAARLDGQCALGQRFWDQSAGIELSCTLHERSTYDAFLPGGEAHGLIVWLVRRYLQAPVDVHLVLTLAPRTPQPMRLQTTEPMRLGWSSWLARRNAGPAALPAARLTLTDRSFA